MNESDLNENESTLREISKAQKTLDDIESKMKKFRSKKKEQVSTNATKAPYPDLNKYFSFLSHQLQNQDFNQSAFSQRQSKEMAKGETINKNNKNYNMQTFHDKFGKQNDSITINQKLQLQKNSSISKIQEYYIQRNQALEEKIKQLKQLKQKTIKDQKLLLRNNEELEASIQARREAKQQSTKIVELKQKVEAMRKKLDAVQQQNNQINIRKKQLQKCIRQALKGQKFNLNFQLQTRPKSNSNGKCKYH